MSTSTISAKLSDEFIAGISMSADEDDPVSVKSLVYGRTKFFSHNNHSDPVKNKVSCGHAAIATLMDFYNRCPYPLQRTDRGIGNADDGRAHYPPQLVDYVFNQYPPFDFFGIKFTVRESILAAMKQTGIKAEETYAEFNGNGEYELSALKKWISTYRLPVLTLLDCHVLNSHMQWWKGNAPGWYVLHWGFIIGFDSDGVIFASWGEVKRIHWNAFMDSWHCPGLPYPNNYFAIYTHL
jgi:hypothetical protein